MAGIRRTNTQYLPEYRNRGLETISAMYEANQGRDAKADLFAQEMGWNREKEAGRMGLEERKFDAMQSDRAARLGLARAAAARAGKGMSWQPKKLFEEQQRIRGIKAGIHKDYRKGDTGTGGTSYRTSTAYKEGDVDTKLRMDKDAATFESEGYSNKDINNFILNANTFLLVV